MAPVLLDEPEAPAADETLEDIAAAAIAPSGRARDFVIFSGAQCVSSIGSWMQKTGFGWLTWELTRSPAWVGAMGVADLVALLWVAPLAGPYTERGNPFRQLMLTQSLLLLLSAVLCVAIGTGHVSIWALWSFALVDSTLQGFNQPVRMTATGLLAGPERVSQAVATNSIAMNVARSLGPMIAGIVIAGWGVAPVLAIDAVSFLAMLAGVWHFRARLDRPGVREGRPLGAAIVGGFAAVARDPLVRNVLLLAAGFSLLARPFFDLLPAFAGAIYGGDPHVLAGLLSAQGIGSLAGALIMLRRRGDGQLAGIARRAGIGLAMAIAAFACVDHLGLALPLMIAAGLGHVICNIAMQSLLQLRAGAGVRGQALSLYSLAFRAVPSLGALVIGLAASRCGLGGVMAVCAAAAGLFIFWMGRRIGLAAIDDGARRA